MHAEHPITAASRRRQAQRCVACSPCMRSSHGGGRRWRRPAVHALAPDSVVLADGGAPAVLALGPESVVLADGGAPAVLAAAPHTVVLADGGAPAVLAPAPHTVVLADGGAHAVLAPSPALPVRADGSAPAVHALALASAMRAFFVCGCVVLALFSLPCVSGSSSPLHSPSAASPSPRHSRHLHCCLTCQHFPSPLPSPLPLLPPPP